MCRKNRYQSDSRPPFCLVIFDDSAGGNGRIFVVFLNPPLQTNLKDILVFLRLIIDCLKTVSLICANWPFARNLFKSVSWKIEVFAEAIVGYSQ